MVEATFIGTVQLHLPSLNVRKSRGVSPLSILGWSQGMKICLVNDLIRFDQTLLPPFTDNASARQRKAPLAGSILLTDAAPTDTQRHMSKVLATSSAE